MFKEKGYDEFLAAKIAKGRESAQKQGAISLNDAKKHWENTLAKKAQELEEFEREVVYG